MPEIFPEGFEGAFEFAHHLVCQTRHQVVAAAFLSYAEEGDQIVPA